MTIAIGYYCDKCGTLDWSCGEFCHPCGVRTRQMIYEMEKLPNGDYHWQLVKDIDSPEYITDKDLTIENNYILWRNKYSKKKFFS